MSTMRSPIFAAIASAALTATLVGGVAIAQTTTPSVINACVAASGNVRIVANASDCKPNETFTFWNQKGEKGDQGLQGLKGDPGVSGRTEVTKTVMVPNRNIAPAPLAIDCPAGMNVLSGGYVSGVLHVFGSRPNFNQWIVNVQNGTEFDQPVTLYAVCATTL